ncbi:MAG: hypothetical protein U9R40_07895 [Synergistota bacterium]|nr:hypothetical protein [Synergistota bacterium]
MAEKTGDRRQVAGDRWQVAAGSVQLAERARTKPVFTIEITEKNKNKSTFLCRNKGKNILPPLRLQRETRTIPTSCV